MHGTKAYVEVKLLPHILTSRVYWRFMVTDD